MKVVPPSSYVDAYNRAKDIESDNKTSQGKKKAIDDGSTKESNDGESKIIQAL